MTWWGPALDQDQRDLAGMLDALAADRGTALTDDAPEKVTALVAELAELGVWTIGTPEDAGGSGADHVTTGVALERLGRYWPALGWASVQAQAAVGVLSGCAEAAEVVEQLHTGAAAVAVVDLASSHVRLVHDHGLRGAVDRIDAACPQPYLLVLDGDVAFLAAPAQLRSSPVRRTGLGGALTCALTVDAPADSVIRIEGADLRAARRQLQTGAAAVAAGIAGAAADGALGYAAGRDQFGGPLTELAVVRQALLDQAARTAVAVRAAFTPAGDEVAAWAVLRHACEDAVRVAADALQSHGGYGYLTEYAAERHLRDAVSLRAATDVTGGGVAAGRTLVGLAPAPAVQEKS